MAVVAAALAGGGFLAGSHASVCASSNAPSTAPRAIAQFGHMAPDNSASFEIEILATSSAADAPRTLHMSAATTNERGYLATSSACLPDPTAAESILAGRRWKFTIQPKPGKSWAQVAGAGDVDMDCVPFVPQPPPQGK